MSDSYNNIPLGTIVPGMTIESCYYLCEASEKQTKGGKPYCDLKLRDKTGVRIAKYWNPLEGFKVKKYVFIKGYSQEFAGSTNIIVQEINNIEESETDISDFLMTVENIEEYQSTFEDYRNQITNPTLKAIFNSIFTPKMQKLFFDAPASDGARYGAVGGALMQSCRIAGASEYMSYSYDLNDFSKELLIAASFIANSGKIYAYDLIDHVPMITVKGVLFGDFALAYQKIILAIINLKQDPKKAKKLAEVDKDEDWELDENIILQLTHLILSSRSGSVNSANKEEKMGAVLPQSIEAMILSQCFLSEERTATVYDTIKSSELVDFDSKDPFTPYDNFTKRRFLKPEKLS